MSTEAEDLKYVVDRARIRDCVVRLARGEDRRDAELISGAYWPEATDDHGIFVGDLKEYLDWVVPGAAAISVTLHTLGQSLIEVQGDRATAETHVTAYHRIDLGDEEHDIVIGGRYLDRLEERGREWRIAHRTMLYDWLRDFGQSVDWSQGVLGMPFLGDHYVGRANGDHSVSVFRPDVG
ncbi:SnoaL-like domain-containing protein [Frankia sp. EI5c]|uniref:nuclear transport factor 2 family protein n=1 Tax=Frankia sp. EI5c TaxID=683316 RepID=UPI0007C27238|nr:nuclear transport factor 2 family protein [Frankia sp. EI5c]OAA27684.1 SnoaL-like domain-containing protein [Frankia sp. EI5c]